MTPPSDQAPLPPPEDSPLVALATSTPASGDWVHEIKQWYFTGSRRLVPGGGHSIGGGASQPGPILDGTPSPQLPLDG